MENFVQKGVVFTVINFTVQIYVEIDKNIGEKPVLMTDIKSTWTEGIPWN